MKLAFASTNPHKLEELTAILGPLGVELRDLSQLGRTVPEPAENGSSLEENARIKATAYARALGQPCLADDSGLEVDALAGAPGIHSARYAGVGGTRDARDRANREKLVRELAKCGAVSRAARLVCVLCLADARGHLLFETRGTLEALVTHEERGDHGFGYDSLLLLPDVNQTLAELSPDELNARSHRGVAARAFHAWLAAHPLPT